MCDTFDITIHPVDVTAPAPALEPEPELALEHGPALAHEVEAAAPAQPEIVPATVTVSTTVPAAFEMPDLSQAVSMIKALRTLTNNPESAFRCREQEAALHHAVTGTEDLCVVAATGSGKSMLFLLLPKIALNKVVVVVAPYLGLLEDLKRRATEARLLFEIWTGQEPRSQPQLLLVSVEKVDDALKAYLSRLALKNQLKAIVMDEVHTYLDDRFRIHLGAALIDRFRIHLGAALITLASVDIKMIFLSATLPPALEEKLRVRVDSPFRILRSPTTRPNLSYRVEHHPDVTQVQVALGELLKSTTLGEKDRVIIVTMTKEQAEAVSKQHGTALYHSDLTEDEKKTNTDQWRSGAKKVMGCTSGFGNGIDYPDVVLVVTFMGSHSLICYSQEAGRGGRGGRWCRCVVLTTLQQIQEKIFGKWSVTKGCRRQEMQREVDGHPSSTCIASGAALCDNCEKFQTGIPTLFLLILLCFARSNTLLIAIKCCFQEFTPCHLHAMKVRSVPSSSLSPSHTHHFLDFPEPPYRQVPAAQITQRAISSQLVLNGANFVAQRLRQLQESPMTCFAHTLSGGLSVGHMNQCPTHRNLCFSCGGNHLEQGKCPYAVKLNEVCFFCGIPGTIGSRTTHPPDTHGKQTCPNRGIIRAVLTLYWSKQLSQDLIAKSPQDIVNYMYALDSNRIPNGVRLFFELVRS